MLVKSNYCSGEFHLQSYTSYEIVIYCVVGVSRKMRNMTYQLYFMYFTKDHSKLTICL